MQNLATILVNRLFLREHLSFLRLVMAVLRVPLVVVVPVTIRRPECLFNQVFDLDGGHLPIGVRHRRIITTNQSKQCLCCRAIEAQ